MFRASIYIAFCGTKNRLRARLRRLREPRYMLGAIAGAAYLYFAVFMRVISPPAGRRGRRGPPAVPEAVARAGSAAGGLLLLLVAALAWLFPMSSRLFEFSEPETQFLFPAPVTRRQLLIHRLIRSQIGLLFAAMLPAFLITAPMASSAMGFTSIPARLARGLGLWVLFLTVRVYFAGVTMARPQLLSRDSRARLMAGAALIVTLGAAAVVVVALVRLMVVLPPQSMREAMDRLVQLRSSGAAGVALAPFVALLQPVLATSGGEFLRSMRDSVFVLLVTVVWVLRCDEVFYASGEAPRQALERRTGAITGPRVGKLAWTLPLSGRPETLFFWKSSMQTLRHTSMMNVLPYLLPIVVFSVIGTTARLGATQSRGPAAGLVFAALMVAGFVALLGPQTVRGDLRGDLPHLETLKTWPVKAAVLIRGEMLWPAAALTFGVWCALLCATILSAAAFPDLPFVSRVSLGVAAMVMAPALVFAQLTVQNASAVLFPAWVATGNQRPRGLDAMGQRLILFGAVLLSMVVMVGPGVMAGGLIAFAFYRWIGYVVAIPATLACLGIVGIEVLLATEALGGAYDRIDPPQVERAE